MGFHNSFISSSYIAASSLLLAAVFMLCSKEPHFLFASFPRRFEKTLSAYFHFSLAFLRLERRTRFMCRSKSPLFISSAKTYCSKTGTVHE